MKSVFSVVFVSAAAVWLWAAAACRHTPPAEKMTPTARGTVPQEKVYIEDVEVVQAEPEVGRVTLRVRGQYPNPAYRIRDYRVRIEGNQIRIVPDVEHDPDAVVIQMLVPFTDTVTVHLDKPGKYQILCQGRSREVVKELRWR